MPRGRVGQGFLGGRPPSHAPLCCLGSSLAPPAPPPSRGDSGSLGTLQVASPASPPEQENTSFAKVITNIICAIKCLLYFLLHALPSVPSYMPSLITADTPALPPAPLPPQLPPLEMTGFETVCFNVGIYISGNYIHTPHLLGIHCSDKRLD